jgi:DNA modification methylase
MPESVTDRPTKAHEYIFLFAKSERYFYDVDAIREPHTHKDAVRNTGDWAKSVKEPGYADALPEAKKANRSYAMSRPKDYIGNINGRNKRTVWNINTKPFSEAHFAVFPPDLIKPCILAGCPEGGIVLDPFMGAGTTAVVCADLGRNYIGIELNPEYVHIANERIKQATRQERLFI